MSVRNRVVNMSHLFSLSGNDSIISSNYDPPLVLQDTVNYELALINLETFNSIPNIDSSNNKFYYGDAGKFVEIAEGLYELKDIVIFLKRAFRNLAIAKGDTIKIELKANNNTLRCMITCNRIVNFIPDDSIGSILGFSKRKLAANTTHLSDKPVNIFKVNAISIDCNITLNSYRNGEPVHILHTFFPLVKPGYKIVESPSNLIYLPINTRQIRSITLKLVDQEGRLVNFRKETITVTLHLRPSISNVQ